MRVRRTAAQSIAACQRRARLLFLRENFSARRKLDIRRSADNMRRRADWAGDQGANRT